MLDLNILTIVMSIALFLKNLSSEAGWSLETLSKISNIK